MTGGKPKDYMSSEEEEVANTHTRRKAYYVRFPDAHGRPFLETEGEYALKTKEEEGNTKPEHERENSWKTFTLVTPPRGKKKDRK